MNTNKNFEKYGDYKASCDGYEEKIEELVEVEDGPEPLWGMTDETIEFAGRTLHRIKALKDYIFKEQYYSIEKNELGGYIEKEENLDQFSWLADNAIVMDKAKVHYSSVVKNNAIIMENAFVSYSSLIQEDSIIKGNAEIYSSIIGGNVCVREDAHVRGNAKINGDVEVFGKCEINGCVIDGKMEIYNNADLYRCSINGYGYRIGKDAFIRNKQDVCSFNNFGSRSDVLTAYCTKNDSARINVGCFHGDIIEFRKRVAKEKSKDSIARKEYELIADIIQTRFIDHDTSEYFENKNYSNNLCNTAISDGPCEEDAEG